MSDRRNFLKTTMSAAAFASTASIANVAHSKNPETKIRKAVKFQMVTEKLTVLDKFKLLKDIGFDGTEIPTSGKFDRREVLRAVEVTGLPVHGVINAASPKLREAIDLAKYLGGDSVLVVAGQEAGKSVEQNTLRWQKLIRGAIPYAEKSEVRLLIENVRATFLKTVEDMVKFIDSFSSPVVGAYFDTGNTITWTKQTAQHWAGVLGPRIAKLDIKDRGHEIFGDPKLRSETAIGTDGGEVHWQKVRQHLEKISFSGWATAEVRGGDRKRLTGIAAWMDQVLAN